MKLRLSIILILVVSLFARAQGRLFPVPGFESRIGNYVDSLRIIDTHEHLFTPEIVRGSSFLDFMLLFQPNGYDDLISAGMPKSLFDTLFNEDVPPVQKWAFIEPYWNNSFNTSYNRVILQSISSIYGITALNESTVTPLSQKIKSHYTNNTIDWFDLILRDSCKIDYIIQDGYYMPGKDNYFRYAKRFDDWILINYKFRIDSLAIMQMDPIYSLEDLVRSLRTNFEEEVNKGMSAVKISIAYSRTIEVEEVETEAAKKVFRTLVNGNEDKKISFREAKPLQDYMLHKLLELADEYSIPVAIHTGLQSGAGNYINNSDPVLLSPLFKKYPEVNFSLFHGSYPFGGELSTLSKTFKNVFIDMNWMYSISPSYSERYLTEWLETVPVSKIMAFGGDAMVPENVFSELEIARRVISNVLINKVREGYFSENEAKTVAKMILRDNALKFYNLL